MEKSVRALTSFMGIVYAGRFYTYISPEQPAARIRQILEVLQPDCVIADSESADDGKLEEAGFSGRVLDYDELCRAEISAEVLAEVRERSCDTDPRIAISLQDLREYPRGFLSLTVPSSILSVFFPICSESPERMSSEIRRLLISTFPLRTSIRLFVWALRW